MGKKHEEIIVVTQKCDVRLACFKEDREVWVNLSDFLDAVRGGTLAATNVVEEYNPQYKHLFRMLNVLGSGARAYFFNSYLLLADDFVICKREASYAPDIFKLVCDDLIGFIDTFNFKHKKVRDGRAFKLNGNRCQKKREGWLVTELPPCEKEAQKEKSKETATVEDIAKIHPIPPTELPESDPRNEGMVVLLAKLEKMDAKIDALDQRFAKFEKVVSDAQLYKMLQDKYK